VVAGVDDELFKVDKVFVHLDKCEADELGSRYAAGKRQFEECSDLIEFWPSLLSIESCGMSIDAQALAS